MNTRQRHKAAKDILSHRPCYRVVERMLPLVSLVLHIVNAHMFGSMCTVYSKTQSAMRSKGVRQREKKRFTIKEPAAGARVNC